MKSLIYIEMKDGKPQNSSLEAISIAKKLGTGLAVVIGHQNNIMSTLISGYGVDVLQIENDVQNQDELIYVLENIVKENDVQTVMFGATQEGKDLAPRLAARLATGCVTDVIDMDMAADTLVVTRPAFGGTVLEKMKFADGKTAVVTTRGGSFPKPEAGEAGKITCMTMEVPADVVKTTLIDKTVEITEQVNLEGADIIVAGGRGCGSEETFALVKELADLLDGVVGASRPAIEAGWISRAHQVGQSGKNVAPKLYIACGISGAMQHISGMTGSDYIVAINKDEDAPIFDIADIGIVGKCEDMLPLLIEAIRSKRA